MKKFNKRIFISFTLLFGLLLVPSFLAAWAEDEGTLGTDFLWVMFAKLFYIIRFPTHTLLWPTVVNHGPTFYFYGLVINCMFYGLVIERLIYFFKHGRTTKEIPTKMNPLP